MNEEREMYSTEVLMALAQLRFIRMPGDRAKAAALDDMLRQGAKLRNVVDFFVANPRSDFYVGLRECKKGVGYLTPVGERDTKSSDAVLAEKDADYAAAQKREAEMSPEERERVARVLREAEAKWRQKP